MACNYYRVFVVILTALCAFFSYICRLNLSLTIERMVVDNHKEIKFYGENSVPLDTYELPPIVSNEEHTLSKIFGFTYLNYPKRIDVKKNRTQEIGAKRLTSSKNVYLLSKKLKEPVDFYIVGSTISDTKSESSVEKSANDDVTLEPLLDWDEKQRNTLLLSFFIGYVVFQIPLARGAEIFGPKALFLFAGFGSALCSLIFPFAARISDGILIPCLVRVLMGGAQSGVFPAGYVLICEWMPTNERAKWFSYPASFSRFGTIVMNLVIPFIIINFGWQVVFYVSGLAIFAWSVLFAIFASNTPNESHWISRRELIYIESHKEPRVGTVSPPQTNLSASGFSINEPEKKPDVSWKKLTCNRPILVLTLVMFSSEWSNMLLLVKLPGFLDRAMNFDLQEIGWWSSVLVTIFCIFYPISSYLALKLENSKIACLTSINVRKIFELIAHTMQGTGCLLIAFYSNKVIVLGALVFMMLGRATVGGGQCLMPPELSKEYAGTVYAFANTIANIAGVIGPGVINFLVDNQELHSSWFSLWVFSGSLFFVVGLIFCLFGDNSDQDYSKRPKLSKVPTRATSETHLTIPKIPDALFKREVLASPSDEVPGKLTV